MKKIWDHAPAHAKKDASDYGDLILYSPVVQLYHEEEFRIDDGEFLHPRRMVTSNPLFPESKDPDVDIVVVVSGGATPQKLKCPESQNGENIPFLMIFSCL